MFKLLILPFGSYDVDSISISNVEYSTLQEIANCVTCIHSVSIFNSLGTVLYHRDSILKLEKEGKKQ